MATLQHANRLLSAEELCAVTGVPRGTLGNLQAVFGIRSEVGKPTRHVNKRLYTAGHATALVLYRGLRERGVAKEHAGAAMSYIWRLPVEQMEACIQCGACYLLCIRDSCLPRLIDMDAIKHPAGVPPEVAAMMQPFAIDVQELWQQVNACINGILDHAEGETCSSR
jgi:ferredoxin